MTNLFLALVVGAAYEVCQRLQKVEVRDWFIEVYHCF